MIRAVLDTNVLASGLIGGGKSPERILLCWTAGLFELVLSEHILSELERTLAKPYFRHATESAWAARQITRLRQHALVTPITSTIEGIATHREDDLILATAVSGGADHLVTGDRALQAIGHYRGITILPPLDFLTLIIDPDPGDASST